MAMYDTTCFSNGTGSDLVQCTTDNVPVVGGAVLAFVFLFFAIVGYSIENSRRGRSNIWLWFTVSGFITTTASFFLYLSPQKFINGETLIILLVASIVSAVLYLFTYE